MDEELRRAALLLPPPYDRSVLALGVPVEDIRLRLGKPVSYTAAGRERVLSPEIAFTGRQMLWTLERAGAASLYAVQDSLRRGYLQAPGGVRIGVCGTGVMQASAVTALKDVSSLAIRVARQCRGAADGLLPGDGEKLENTLIVSPPGAGKTSLLRDMIRQLSDRGVRTAVADERGEIAAMHAGMAGFDVGRCTDVLSGIEKRTAVMMLLRTMAPQLIALDEISERADALAVEYAASNGAAILATVHGASVSDLRGRPALEAIFRRGIFGRLIFIEITGGARRYRAMRLPARKDDAA